MGKFISYEKRFKKKAYNYTDKKIERVASIVRRNVANEAPIDTGKLRSSIMAKKKKLMKYFVFSDEDYAKYVELGTSKMRPRPFFKKGLKRSRGKW